MTWRAIESVKMSVHLVKMMVTMTRARRMKKPVETKTKRAMVMKRREVVTVQGMRTRTRMICMGRSA